MRFLLDTNVVIPLEPTRGCEIEGGTEAAAEVVRLALEAGHQVCVHPAIRVDVGRDRDPERRALRSSLLGKYPSLPHPPVPSDQLQREHGSPAPGSNDWVDLQLIAAVESDSVDYLVTEDRGIHRTAASIGFGARVCTMEQALEVLRGLQVRFVPAPMPAESIFAHELNTADPIFGSLRVDYPEWLTNGFRSVASVTANASSSKMPGATPPLRFLRRKRKESMAWPARFSSSARSKSRRAITGIDAGVRPVERRGAISLTPAA